MHKPLQPLHPLPGHPFTINAQPASRSLYELFGNAFVNPRASTERMELSHPPVLLIQEGGGEQLLNHDSVIAQLNLLDEHNKKVHSANNLSVWLIDLRQSDSQPHSLLLHFLFGSIERLHYEKKDSNNDALLWRQAMHKAHEDPVLKSCLESELFDDEPLSSRHYRKLLSVAKLSPSSISQELRRLRHGKACQAVKNKQTSTSPSRYESAKAPAEAQHNQEEEPQDQAENESMTTLTLDNKKPEPPSLENFSMELEHVIDRAIKTLSLGMDGDV